MAQLRRSQQSVVAYHQADKNRARVQAIFTLTYVSTAILVLVGATWVGMTVATQIAAPVARLVQAADRATAPRPARYAALTLRKSPVCPTPSTA